MTCMDLVYDIGMHQGEDMDYYLLKGFRVIAFEANPDLVERCRHRFASAVEEGRLTIVAGAIAPPDFGERVTFHKSEKTVWGTIVRNWADRNETLGGSSRIVDVPRVDFAEVLSAYGVPHFMKIDVEGIDQHVLSCLHACAQQPQFLSIESDKVDFDALVAEIDLLSGLGYDRFRAVQQASVPGRRALVLQRDGTSVAYRFQRHASGPFGDDLVLPWRSREQIIADYSSIFRLYRWFGDRSGLRQAPLLGQFVRALNHLPRWPVPGWYDTHAMRSA